MQKRDETDIHGAKTRYAQKDGGREMATVLSGALSKAGGPVTAKKMHVALLAALAVSGPRMYL